MKKIDLIGRIKRTIRCQMRKYYAKKWQQVKPEDFYTNPKRVASLWFASCEGRMPNYKDPTLFSERLTDINLKAYTNETQRDLRIVCADKYAVRQYVADKGLIEILNECYGVWDNFEDIDFDKLPNQFVLKTTNGSGQNFICKDKSQMNYAETKQMFEDWMQQTKTFGLTTGEWHYCAMKPRIIGEKYLSTLGEGVSIVDYKFHCMHGHVFGEFVCYDRVPNTHIVNFDHYTANWELTDGILPSYHLTRRPITKPSQFEKMKEIAQVLSKGIDYVRIDLYEIDGNVLFGEMTFTPAGNMLPYYSEHTLKEMLKFYDANK